MSGSERNLAAEGKLRCERRAGEMLTEMEKNKEEMDIKKYQPRQEYYLKDGRGPFETVQEVLDALGLDKEERPHHNRWSRLSTELKDTIQGRPKAGGTVSLKTKFQPRDKVRFSNRATKYSTADLRKRTRTVVGMFYDPVNKCSYYEVGARGNGTLGFFRSYMLLPADGNQHTIGRPRQKRRYNRHTKLLSKPPNRNLGANHRGAYPRLRQRRGRVPHSPGGGK